MTQRIVLALLLYSNLTLASDIKSVSVLSDHIVVLNFSDGYIDYHGYHQMGETERTIKDELDVAKASRTENYSFSSSNDIAYQNPVFPFKIGRKSKPSGMSVKCTSDDKSRCMSDFVMEHYLYLFLSKPLKNGKNYSITLNGLAKNKKVISFKYDVTKTRSLALHVNQLGYVPKSPIKIAYVSHWMGDAGPLALDSLNNLKFLLIDVRNGKEVFSGVITKQKDFETGGPDALKELNNKGSFVAADVWQCDFSDFNLKGEYILSVDRMGVSFPFKIDENVYFDAYYNVCRNLYHQRSGIALKEPYTRFERDAPHNPNITPGFRLRYTRFRSMDAQMESQTLKDLEALFDDSVDTRNMWGWYQDAGDWDSYASHSVVPAFLLTTFELKPRNFNDNQLNIPESGNGIPDIMDEANWLINHYRRTKGPTGGNAGGRIEGDNYPQKEVGHGLPSYEDIRHQWIVYGEEPRMTFIYSRLAAQLAHCYSVAAKNKLLGKNINVNDSIRFWKSESLKAFEWAQKNLRVGDEEKILADRTNAEGWIYKLTGNAEWLSKFKADLNYKAIPDQQFEQYKWGIWAYVTITDNYDGFDTVLKTKLVSATEKFAQSEVTDAIDRNRSFRMGGSMDVKAKNGQGTTPWVMPAIIAWEVTKNQKYLKAVYSTCDYMLGGNQLDMTWITGVGKKYPTQVFNIDWWYNKKGIKEIVPGIIPYGPTSDCDWMHGKNGDCDAHGWWDSDYAHSKCYPNKNLWPVHERWYDNRYAPPSSEYTVHQTTAPATAVYGYLLE